MTTIHPFVGAKGGVGTTTAACLLALKLANAGESVLLVDNAEAYDCSVILGCYTERHVNQPFSVLLEKLDSIEVDGPIHPGLYEGYDHVVIDYGRKIPVERENIVIVTDGSYVGAKRLIDLSIDLGQMRAAGEAREIPPRVLLVLDGQNRPIGAADHENVSGLQIIKTTRSPEIARACDSGLLSVRRHPLLAAAVTA